MMEANANVTTLQAILEVYLAIYGLTAMDVNPVTFCETFDLPVNLADYVRALLIRDNFNSN